MPTPDALLHMSPFKTPPLPNNGRSCARSRCRPRSTFRPHYADGPEIWTERDAMTTLTWSLDKSADDQDDLPACTSCRKRKLRCSREAPTCYHCTRTGSQCSYDSKTKPGPKSGAIEALNCRIAVLERLLLDKEGTPLVTFTADGQVIGQGAPPASEAPSVSESVADGVPHTDRSTARRMNTKSDHAISDNSQYAGREKRKRGTDTHIGNVPQLEYQTPQDLVKALPPREVLVKAVDYFCDSFHHWIPFLHKAKSQAEVLRSEVNADFAPVLHALLAVVLPWLDLQSIQIEYGELIRQASTSRDLAMRYSMTNTSLQGLQALVILVFEQLNNGNPLKAYPLIAMLIRTVDFLQLTLEPGAARSRVLMKPLNLLQPAHDWTELEARRRLFWCIFLLDRYTSAHTGWNTSLTAEDVHRRLPADGAYFTRETPVHCPFFGIWNKSYANIGASLSAHVPAQYEEEATTTEIASEIETPTPTSPSTVDSSNLGAFAYCIEATESLNQVTTFFLQQRIDWQNRQHVVDWLTRFKELDLRLIHWKMFLPPRWKDSDISTDASLINMDPNLTLAHLTHNTSMILLHYPVAFPPVQWSNLVQLPSACSAETCQLAAVETSRIAGKFLRHTPIPFVNPQFSLCVFVAAKVLLASSQETKQQAPPEFDDLVQELWTISARWLHINNNETARETCMRDPRVDLAGLYARHVEQLREKCRKDPEFRFDFFDHSCMDLESSPLSPAEISVSAITAEAGGARFINGRKNANDRFHDVARKKNLAAARTKRPKAGRANGSGGLQQPSIAMGDKDPEASFGHQQRSPKQILDSPSHTRRQDNSTSVSTFPRSYPHPNNVGSAPIFNYFSPRGTSATINNNLAEQNFQPSPQSYDQDMAHDALFMLSDALMDPQYMELDRVITFEDANFQAPHSNLGWP